MKKTRIDNTPAAWLEKRVKATEDKVFNILGQECANELAGLPRQVIAGIQATALSRVLAIVQLAVTLSTESAATTLAATPYTSRFKPNETHGQEPASRPATQPASKRKWNRNTKTEALPTTTATPITPDIVETDNE